MILAPTSWSSCGVMVLTTPSVPTGMKQGVRTSPCASTILPALAWVSLSFISTWKFMNMVLPFFGLGLACPLLLLSLDQHAVAIAVKPVFLRHCLPVQLHGLFPAYQRRHQQKQAGLGQMEI